MKKRILGILLALVMTASCIALCGCFGNRDVDPIPKRIELNLPDKIYYKCIDNTLTDYTAYATIIKDGNEYYVKAPTRYYTSSRLEVYVKDGLQHEACVAEGYGGWGFISARWDYSTNAWIIADNDGIYAPWHANDYNQDAWYAAKGKFEKGYSDVNTLLETNITVTQLANERLVIDGRSIDCIVWEYVYENGNIYNKSKHWYASETHVCLQINEVFDKEANIDSSEYKRFYATLYVVGVDMLDALADLDEPRPRCNQVDLYN